MEWIKEEGEVDGTCESSLITTFFNFFFYLAYVPFKTKFDPVTQTYRVQECRYQKILCITAHILVTLLFGSTVVNSWIGIGGNDAEPLIVLVLDFVNNSCNFIGAVVVIRLLWRERDLYLEVVQCTRFNSKRHIIPKAMICIFLLAVTILMGSANWCILFTELRSGLNSPRHPGTTILDLTSTATSGKNGSFSVFGMHIPTAGPPSPGFWLTNILMTYMGIFYLTLQGILIVGTLALTKIGNQMKQGLRQSLKEGDLERGLEAYRNLKLTSDKFRKLFGNQLAAYYMTSVTFYAEFPYVFLGKRGDSEKLGLCYFIISGFVWVVAAEFHHSTRSAMLKWMQAFAHSKAKINAEDRLQLVGISGEMITDPVALASKFFAVTYSHLAGMIGLILTYAVFVFQLHNV